MTASPPSPLLPWDRFTLDPRRTEAAALRASDRDRAIVQDVLTEGYAEGQLTKDEFLERAGRAAAVTTLSEVPALVSDLISVSFPGGEARIARTRGLRTDAVLHWESQRDVLLGLLVVSVVCWTTWFFAAYQHNASPGFPWPVPITLAAGVPLLRMMMRRKGMTNQTQLRLE